MIIQATLFLALSAIAVVAVHRLVQPAPQKEIAPCPVHLYTDPVKHRIEIAALRRENERNRAAL